MKSQKIYFKYLILLLVAFTIFQLKSFAQDCEGKSSFDIAAMEMKAHQTKSLNKKLTFAGENYDVKYQRLQWKVDPNVNYILGVVTTYFIPVADSIIAVEYNLADSMIVDSIIYHSASVSFTHTNEILLAKLPFSIKKGTLDSITVIYHGAPVSTGFGSFVVTTHGILKTPILWTLTEPYVAQDWWPCKVGLSDKVDSIDVIVNTPKPYRVASNGLLISETDAGKNRIFHWQSHYPIANYLIAIAVTEYDVYKDTLHMKSGEKLPLLNYTYHEDSDKVGALDKIKDIINLYDSLTVPYTFSKEKYGHAQWGWAGGMENQTMSFVSDFSMALIAHECAHQWFGDRVTCTSWQDVWLNEGFAEYFDALSREHLLPPSAFLEWKQSAKAYTTSSPDGSVFCTDTLTVLRIFDYRLSYQKGAFLLHMLRWKLGDSIFFLSIKNYLNDPKLKFSFAKTADLKKHLETTSGQDLTKFFAQWFYGEGYPTYQLECKYSWDSMRVKINQTTSHTSVSFYDMKVPVRFQDGSHDTTVIFNHTFSGEVFTFPIKFKPRLIAFDPNIRILSGDNSISYTSSGIDEISLDNFNLQLSPNPTNNILHIYGNFRNQNSKIVLKDLLGKTLYQAVEKCNNGESNFDIDISKLPAGIYILEVSDGDNFIAKKVIKQ
ncbi:MAG: M1 family aminopeptidase [Bacteroidetes bacterium]|nr:M1 family aminopeptidase [Bacteroidota bacterium]